MLVLSSASSYADNGAEDAHLKSIHTIWRTTDRVRIFALRDHIRGDTVHRALPTTSLFTAWRYSLVVDDCIDDLSSICSRMRYPTAVTSAPSNGAFDSVCYRAESLRATETVCPVLLPYRDCSYQVLTRFRACSSFREREESFVSPLLY